MDWIWIGCRLPHLVISLTDDTRTIVIIKLNSVDSAIIGLPSFQIIRRFDFFLDAYGLDPTIYIYIYIYLYII